ncbi:ABC-type transport auxiliary lipoprotein family protein [Diaphorobacter caeni]|uniref:ABC-type transport auxiliary lipoprotein family protein n=1 Tax=Diaphorobacter caeni TaxID=2784387 RepID=UPI001E3089F4|nr:ABC-type transport auxiliary lipoprotein family protein [Diaphorobacter caeni]
MNTAIFPTKRSTKGLAAAVLMLGVLAVTGCGSILPTPPQRADVYDFGPGLQQLPSDQAVQKLTLPPIALSDFNSTGLPDGRTAVFYRLAYSNGQLLHPYTLARWSQTPATLMQQAVRDRLSPQRAVIYGDTNIDQQVKGGKSPTVLRAEVEEFSQVFSSERESVGLVRVRASLVDSLKAGDELVAQRLFVAQRPAASPNAAGGAKALADAAAQVAEDIAKWVEQSGR